MNAPLHRELPAGLLDSRPPPCPTSPTSGTATSSGSSPTTSPSPPSRPASTRTGRSTATSKPCCATPPPGSRRRRSRACTLEIVRLPGPHAGAVLRGRRPPAPACTQTVLMYGHLDKQPEFTGWRNDLGPLDAQVRGRQALWPRRRRRRLCGLRQHRRRAGAQGAEGGASAHRRPDRDLRGIRLLRPAALRRRAAPAPGRRGAGDLPGLRRRQLRPALAHHLAARHGQRHAQGGDPDRGRAFRRRLGPGALELSHHAAGARPPGRQQDRPPAAGRASIARCRPSGWRRRRPRPPSWATRSTSAFPGRTTTAAAPPPSRCRPPPTRCRR